jgi:transposase
VSDEEWALVAPSLTLMREEAPQREHDLRDVFNGLRWLVRAGAPWRMMPNDLPPWEAVYKRPQRWLKAGVFEAIVHALREVLRLAETLVGLHFLAFAIIMLKRFADIMSIVHNTL